MIEAGERAADEAFAARALLLAHRGVALAHPNPMVGAVLVKNDHVIAEGFHTYEGSKHAEIIVLEAARSEARGATLYLNLEPCCHIGRTGPCTKAIRAAGVRRVVVSLPDPNPAVAGRGIRELRRAGIAVTTGVHETEAKRLNEAFAKWIRTRQPFVTLKTALTLDGQIASPGGTVTWLTSPESRQEVQRLRHAADALLTGIGTVLADDPRLTDRTALPRRKRLLRVIVDSRLRLSPRLEIAKSARDDVLVCTTRSPDSARARALRKSGVEILPFPSRRGRVDLRAALRELGRREVLRVIVEAGGELNGALLEAGLVDKMILFYAPRILGSVTVPVARMRLLPWNKVPALASLTLRRFGADFAVEGYFHDVYGNH